MRFLLSLVLSITLLLSPSFALAGEVFFNTQTHKYHQMSCRWAKKCTVHCVKISDTEAVRRGGIRCKVCGG